MATGTIIQKKGPFTEDESFNFTGLYIIGVSLGEKDFMSYNNQDPSYSVYEDYPRSSDLEYTYHQYGDLYFILNNKEIHIGRANRYETQEPIENPTIVFPDGAPASLIIDLVQITT